jgi:SprT protein
LAVAAIHPERDSKVISPSWDFETDEAKALKRRAHERTHRLLQLARTHFGIDIPEPDIRFDLPGKTAGQVHIRAGRLCLVRYNLGLLQRHPEDFLTATVPHETAHLVTVRLFGTGVKPHGREWRAVMRLFGAEPRRCHDYDVEGLQARRIRRFSYRCGCRSHLLTSIRHNRILDGHVYLCRGCGQPLELATEDREGEPR